MPTICLDPGHGGADPGAIGDNGLLEKDVALAIVLLIENKLHCEDYQVYLTRKEDRDLSLIERANYANQKGVDVFVSIHLNSAKDNDNEKDPEGIETFCYYKSQKGRKLATDIQNALTSRFPSHRNRGVKEAGFAVLKLTQMPAALVETEFLSSLRWEEWLGKPETHERYADAIAEGIKAYFI